MAKANYDFWASQALREIKHQYGVSVRMKDKSFLKFGQNTDIDSGVEETVWLRGGHETLPTGNVIDTISSSSTSDMQNVLIEGHTMSNGKLNFVEQAVTLNGRNKVVLTTPLSRASRMYNNDSVDFHGTVYAYEDDTLSNGEPQTQSKIHLQTSGGNNQTLKASTSLGDGEYGLITYFYASVNKKQAACVDFKIQVRELGKVFRTQILRSAHSTGGNIELSIRPYLIVPPNSDIRITSESGVANVSVTAGFNSLVALTT